MTQPATTYYVDNEPQTTTQQKLTVRAILTNAGYLAEEHYLVELKGNHQEPHKNLDEEINVHNNQKFAAVFTGATPVSHGRV
jgi:hypothetical protein